MNIQEIRIGNWIIGNGKEFQVYAETFADIESTYGEFKPIPLTEEWLVKMGIVQNERTTIWNYKEVWFWWDGIELISV